MSRSIGAIRPLDPQLVLNGLKDFQRRTVEYAFRRLYTDGDSTHRFLVADEVGLGKTMIARGVIAKAVEHLWNKVERIDIVYVCSNAEIATQNIDRLRLDSSTDIARATRATLLPIEIHDMASRKVNFISMTPGTSLDPQGGTGIAKERALLLRMLLDHWKLHENRASNVLRCNVKFANFKACRDHIQNKTINQDLQAIFLADLDRHVDAARSAGLPDLKSRFEALCDALPRRDSWLDEDQLAARKELVSELRAVLGSSCIRALRPDLVILDEFQRFKHLLDRANPEAELAQTLFDYANERNGNSEAVRVLLLSATPYKMYSLQQEHDRGESNHYEDFVATFEFLTRNSITESRALRNLLKDFRVAMLRLGDTGLDQLRHVRDQLQKKLRRVMARTERLAATDDRSGMLRQRPADMQLDETDIRHYLAVADVAQILDHGNIVEYWKSAPYLLNFMDDYQLKRGLQAGEENGVNPSLARRLRAMDSGLLNWADVAAYRRIDPANARMRCLLNDTIEQGLWKLLWLPPSMPYYQMGGFFSEVCPIKTTKRLVFSSWKVVPKVIAAVVSHEAERHAIGRSHRLANGEISIENSEAGRKTVSALLRFNHSEGRLTGMPVLGLLYPSSSMAKVFDPAQIENSSCSISQILSSAARQLAPLLDAVISRWSNGGDIDERWYWAAPILMDLHADEQATRRFWEQSKLAAEWSGEREPNNDQDDQSEDEKNADSVWNEHVQEARKLIDKANDRGRRPLGKPPEGLSETLATSLVGNPAITALRSIARVVGSESVDDEQARLAAARVAWKVRKLFNRPEVISLVRGLPPAEPYWLSVLEYCVDGCLQSVLDEYAHVLRDSLGVVTLPAAEAAAKISAEMCSAIGLRTVNVGVDNIRVRASGKLKIAREKMRARFAARFGHARREDESAVTRSDHVRAAFNSPFWPFVLASTSVGQEGLDFHHYCHAIVHWNVPSNPVDLEQREGRIHRYKGHAVRKNVALKHPTISTRPLIDRWHEAFRLAEQSRELSDNELVPFWVFPHSEGASIDRYVPSLPLSRDIERFSGLRSTLAIYRMVFGQPRQDELVTLLLDRFDPSTVNEIAREFRINLEPPKRLES